ncbi:hypothetical protein RFI_13186 [Reticulomyxa filosa]|uniref:Uncharacterized protein n=1 Tax=Reticulomyxa filosa TaxID=46433 RepID=X6NE10_RETFI|nr:hypothetical protein RFI_13186 [Reticulomyxa filosa]|eukprot:ETO23974.1 hypothetical protein RFI_13186 [Reticulomyxa filosa]
MKEREVRKTGKQNSSDTAALIKNEENVVTNEEKQDKIENLDIGQELSDEKQDRIESEDANENGTKEDTTNENVNGGENAAANTSENVNGTENANGNADANGNDEAINATQTILSEEDLNQLKKYLPYFHEFINKPEHSVLSMSEYKENPDLYLQAILRKYNVDHPKTLQSNAPKKSEENLSAYHEQEMPLRPWIEG